MKLKPLLIIAVMFLSYAYAGVMKTVPMTMVNSLPDNLIRPLDNAGCLPTILCSYYVSYTLIFLLFSALAFLVLFKDTTKGQ